jgi:tartrate dehydratase alpha subunit/fumarate hydratase class I-like protein
LSGALAIRRAPQDVTAAEGETAHFSVEADGVRGIAFQWLVDDEPVTGATGAIFQWPATAGDHLAHISVLVSGGGATLQSRQAVLRVVQQ